MTTINSPLLRVDTPGLTIDGPLVEPANVLPDLVEPEINRVATQYRESPNLLGFARAILGQVDETARVIYGLPDFFDLDSAVGEQLTILGRQLGWPRCHCVCVPTPVFGFACTTPSLTPIVGFCQGGTWINCNDVGSGDLCLSDDAVYRGYLKARRYQMLGLYDVQSLGAAVQHVWGSQGLVLDAPAGAVVVAPGRHLSSAETQELPLAVRVLPVAPGIRVLVHLGPGPFFGFGTGWGGFCDDSEWVCPVDPHAYDCAA